MKIMIIQEFRNHMENLVNRIRCFRFITFVIMLFFFMDMYLNPFRGNIRIMGQRGNIAVLPFLQTSDYFMKVLFLSVVYFYSNVPFMEKEELFYLNRLGKSLWGRRNIIYIAGSSIVLTVCLLTLSVLDVVSVGKLSLSWGSVYKTLSLTGGMNLSFEIPYPIIKAYSPLLLLGLVLCLDLLVIFFIGMFMYTVSLFGHRVVACIIAIVLVILPSIDAWLGGRLVYFSPVSWLDCSNWRIGYDNRKPDLPYMLVAILFLNLLLIIFSQSRVKKMEWKTMDD